MYMNIYIYTYMHICISANACANNNNNNQVCGVTGIRLGAARLLVQLQISRGMS